MIEEVGHPHAEQYCMVPKTTRFDGRLGHSRLGGQTSSNQVLHAQLVLFHCGIKPGSFTDVDVNMASSAKPL